MMVSVCINTYKRPHVLKTLQSVSQQILPPGVELQFVVCDNDADGSGRPMIDKFIADTGHAVDYEIVSEKNIALARNSAVRRATGEWIAFLDDDEWVKADWLARLLACAETYGADLVQGHAVSEFEEGAEKWISKADPLSKRWGASGKRLRYASTCNLLVRSVLLRDRALPFNPTFGKMGNDDAEMSYRLQRSGAKIVVCDDAPAFEVVPVNRSNVDYLKSRNRGFGQAYMYLVREYLQRSQMIKLFCFAFVKACSMLVVSEIFRFLDKSVWLRFRIVYWVNLGKLDYFLGLKKIENY